MRRARERAVASRAAQAQAPVLGLDLGGTLIRAVVVDLAGTAPRVLGRDERTTPQDSAEGVVAALAASAAAAASAAGLALVDLAAAGCASPGPLDHRSGVVHRTPQLPALEDFPLRGALEDALGRAVVVDRDTVMAAIGEVLAGAAKRRRDIVYLTVSTGVGGAIVSGGRLLRGAGGLAGELGHWPVALPRGSAVPRCGCGAPGCVEAFAGGRNLASRFGAETPALYAAARAGDARALALVAEAAAALGCLAVGVVNALNPELIVVGGAIARHEPAHVLDVMREAIADRAFRAAAAAATVVPAALGPDVGPLGAALAAREIAAGRAQWFGS